MRMTEDGLVRIPEDIRRQAGLAPGRELRIEYDGTAVRILPGEAPHPTPGDLLVQHLRAHGGDIPLSTDEIMAMTRGE